MSELYEVLNGPKLGQSPEKHNYNDQYTGFVHFFRPKIQGLFKAFQGHIFPLFKDSRGAKSSPYNATSDAQSRECADFRLRHLRSFVG